MLGLCNLRLGADNAKSATAVADVLGTALPTPEKVATQQALEQALTGEHSLVADVTGGTTLLNISGAHAQDLLEKGTYVDLHHSAFQAGQFYNTQIAHAPAMIVKNADNDFSLVVRRSFSHHIVDGAAEYGVVFR